MEDKVIIGMIKILVNLMRNDKPIPWAIWGLLLVGDIRSLLNRDLSFGGVPPYFLVAWIASVLLKNMIVTSSYDMHCDLSGYLDVEMGVN